MNYARIFSLVWWLGAITRGQRHVSRTGLRAISGAVRVCSLGVLILVGTTATQAQQGQLAARPLTFQEIKDLGLPPDTQRSGGLFTVGLGQPVYLEAQVTTAIPASNIVGVTWVLTNTPFGSATALLPSPLAPSVPIYSPGDRAVFRVADRRLLRPDLSGKYTVIATVMTTTTNIVVRHDVTGSTYLGAATCIICHSGGVLADKRGWTNTSHASFFTKAIDGLKSNPLKGPYTKECIQCHNLGYDTNSLAVNDGFDDVAALLNWIFPSVLTNGNWAAMPSALKEVANVQCESCHGPGTYHAGLLGAPGAKEAISVSFSSGDCAQCHDYEPYHNKTAEWNNSKHAIATRYPTGESRAACVRCHSGIGYVDFVDKRTPPRTAYEAITCSGCHDPHNGANPNQLRKLAPVTLMDGITTITNGGKGTICMDCHQARRDAKTYVETTAGSSNFGPHYGTQSDMLAGANAVTYGKLIPSSGHKVAVVDTCVACHLQAVAETDPGHTQVGGHTFKVAWDGGTPGNSSDDTQLVAACVNCHGSITSFDFLRQDYNGDGVVEGVQTEVQRLLDELGMLLPPNGPTVAVTSAYTRPQLRAAYNYLFVKDDGSRGVHNTAYAVGLLKASIADLTDDADKDGLSDTWEKTNFGSITATDGTGDADTDGVNDALELAAGTNPKVKDSDNDGFDDKAELSAGSNPTDAQDVPGFIVKLHTAVEIQFASQQGFNYQIQKVSALTSSWQNAGSPIAGTGGIISYLTSTQTEAEEFYRVLRLP